MIFNINTKVCYKLSTELHQPSSSLHPHKHIYTHIISHSLLAIPVSYNTEYFSN